MGMLGRGVTCKRRGMRCCRWDTPRFGCVGSAHQGTLSGRRGGKQRGSHALDCSSRPKALK
eukprot:5574470-Prymnesium_polylepis.1